MTDEQIAGRTPYRSLASAPLELPPGLRRVTQVGAGSKPLPKSICLVISLVASGALWALICVAVAHLIS